MHIFEREATSSLDQLIRADRVFRYYYRYLARSRDFLELNAIYGAFRCPRYSQTSIKNRRKRKNYENRLFCLLLIISFIRFRAKSNVSM